jgi:hypothetical protein
MSYCWISPDHDPGHRSQNRGLDYTTADLCRGILPGHTKPDFEMSRAVDIVQLLGSGVRFGATMVGMIFMLRGMRP